MKATLPKNQFKAEFTASPQRARRGIWMTMASATSAEICAGSGADWLLFDGEHAPYTVASLLDQLRAASGYPMPLIVRPVETTPAHIKQVLDLGAQNLLLPMVDTPEQARAAMRAVRYAPRGIRGVGASVARAGNWGRYTSYMEEAEAELFVLLQIESREALSHLDELLEVEGPDGFFIGPADLGASLGNPPAEELHAIVCDALAKIRAAGLVAGSLAFDDAVAEQYIAAGANFIATTADSTLLVEALAAKFPEG
ncbi:2-keto-3-deoxy-L-rhamnonate aldolase [Actinotignum sanguinis]|nr:2-keto-3-deoxy-L-rhamnonate aldolase [Actinotignum sanguinis]